MDETRANYRFLGMFILFQYLVNAGKGAPLALALCFCAGLRFDLNVRVTLALCIVLRFDPNVWVTLVLCMQGKRRTNGQNPTSSADKKYVEIDR